MTNDKLIEMTKEIVIAMASTSSQYHANEQSAQELVKAMDVIYNKLLTLAKNDYYIVEENQ